MGWASGSGIAEDLWVAVEKYIPKEKRRAVAKLIIEVFENADCDTMQETSFYDLVYLWDEKKQEMVERK